MPSDRFSDADIVDRTLRLMRQPLAGFFRSASTTIEALHRRLSLSGIALN